MSYHCHFQNLIYFHQKSPFQGCINFYSGKSPGEGCGYPLQYSGLKNSTDYIVRGVTKSQTRLSDYHFTSFQTYSGVMIALCIFLSTSQTSQQHSFHLPSTYFDSVLISVTDLLWSTSRILFSRSYMVFYYADTNMEF